MASKARLCKGNPAEKGASRIRSDRYQLLLPQVRHYLHLPGKAPLPDRLSCEVADKRVERAALRLLETPSATPKHNNPSTILFVTEGQGVFPHRDGYRLVIHEQAVRIAGASSAGCFYGLQTLGQLARIGDDLPCCEITDWPDFSTRGLLHDVSRGKVPKLSTLKLLADRLATLKANQLQLYIEHTFVFGFDSSISDEQNGLTAGEIKELDAYCRERFIDLVPAVATLGHMGRVLSLPQYRHLAEIEPTKSWEEMSWPQRARGLTLDVQNPASHKLVENIWTEILNAFSSPVVNICGDEPWDLGKGRNKDALSSKAAIGSAYIDHVVRTHEVCAKRGRRTQMWSDVVTHYPEQFDRLPRDIAILHWGYDDRSDYEGTKRFVDAGLDTICCPGTSGWKRVLSAMNLAERNNLTFARAGKQHGASGLVNTDWGDHGHFNALACSWHAIALGASAAWNASSDSLDNENFGLAFQEWLFGSDQPPDLLPALRGASAIAERCETWRILWQPLEVVRDDPTLPSVGIAEEAAGNARRACERIARIPRFAGAEPRTVDHDELLMACRASQLVCDKIRLARGLSIQESEATEGVNLVARLMTSTWNARNKPCGLRDILSALNRLSDEFCRT